MPTNADEPRRKTAKAQATRQRIIEAASKMFAEHGYERASMRALGDELGMTTGAIYDHFRNKADLLTAAVADGIAEQVERPETPAGSTYPEGAANLFAQHRRQAELRSLLLGAAAAAKADEAVREGLRAIQIERMTAWAGVAQRYRSSDLDDDVDVDTLVKLLWALEFGLVIFDVFGIEPPDAEQTGLAVARLFRP